MIRFDAKAQIIITRELEKGVATILEEEESKKTILVIDSNLIDRPKIKGLINNLENKIGLQVLSIPAVEPTTDLVNEYSEKLQDSRADMFIGIGGGSILDLTKALSVMLVNDGSVEDYHGTGKKFMAGVKKILIPTTAGTGSEVTPGAVLTNRNKKFKRAIGGKYVAPDYAILDAGLTLSMPDNVVASTGMDALGHAVESYTAKCANEMTRMYSQRAFSLVFNYLPKVFENKQDMDLREKVLLGSCLAGYAIYNSNTGAAHSISYALGIYNNVPHGLAVARLLPEVVIINLDKGCTLYSDLYDLIDDAEESRDLETKSRRFSEILKNYRPLSYIDKTFRDYGLNKDNYQQIAERGLDLTSALSNNPVEFGLDDSRKVLQALI